MLHCTEKPIYGENTLLNVSGPIQNICYKNPRGKGLISILYNFPSRTKTVVKLPITPRWEEEIGEQFLDQEWDTVW